MKAHIKIKHLVDSLQEYMEMEFNSYFEWSCV